MISRDGEFVAFSEVSLLKLTTAEVVAAVAEGINADESALDAYDIKFFNESFQIDLLGVDRQEEIAPGDIMRAGLRLTHSLIGAHATVVETFIWRLACRNGMVHRDCESRRGLRTRRLPTHMSNARQLQLDQVRRLAATTWDGLQQKLESIQALQEEQVDNVEELLRRWVERGRLSANNLLPPLMDAWREEGGNHTAYGVMNAITRVATHLPDLSFRQLQILSSLAGILSFRQRHMCPRCFSVGAYVNAALNNLVAQMKANPPEDALMMFQLTKQGDRVLQGNAVPGCQFDEEIG